MMTLDIQARLEYLELLLSSSGLPNGRISEDATHESRKNKSLQERIDNLAAVVETRLPRIEPPELLSLGIFFVT
jgi:hypothetical protein